MPGRYKSGVRVIAGRWKGTTIAVPSAAGLRPTTDRMRETLFNWLQPRIRDARCLDLFAGSGILSLEALSRGAARAVAVDSHPRVVAALSDARARLGATGLDARLDRAERFLKRAPDETFDVVFVDPPFGEGAARRVCRLLQESSWLAPGAVIYVETARGGEPACPEGWLELRRANAGNVAHLLFQAPSG